MSNTIRCKFKVTEITQFIGSRVKPGTRDDYEACVYHSISMSPVSPLDKGGEENRKFWDATPSGSFVISVQADNVDHIKVGKTYYIDITEAE